MTSRRLRRPLLVPGLCALLVLPLRVVGYGWQPEDDARRHAAKALADDPWGKIPASLSGAQVDQRPGWHAVLGVIHRDGIDTLSGSVVVSIAPPASRYRVARLYSREHRRAVLGGRGAF